MRTSKWAQYKRKNAGCKKTKVHRTASANKGTKFIHKRFDNRTQNLLVLPCGRSSVRLWMLWHAGPIKEHGGCATTTPSSRSLIWMVLQTQLDRLTSYKISCLFIFNYPSLSMYTRPCSHNKSFSSTASQAAPTASSASF